MSKDIAMENSSSNNGRQAPPTALAVRSRNTNGLSPNGLPPNGVPHQANGGTMAPTWSGFIHTTYDALIVLEACLQGTLNHIPRRPHDRERGQIIASGNVFIYEENASGIKRWTDGVTWSPSRIMNNFLVYRELSEPFPAGEKKKARKRKRGAEENDPSEPLSAQSEQDRKLVGSLVDSYGFKPGGLIKKTLNVKYKNVNHHIVSYYNLDDVKNGNYSRPPYDYRLSPLRVRQELIAGNQFKAGFELEDTIDPFQESTPQIPPPNMMPMPMPMSMPGAHDSPLSTHIPNLPPVPAPLHFPRYPSTQYVPQSQSQQMQNYPFYPPHLPILDSNPDEIHGSMATAMFVPTTATSNQSTAFDPTQLNHNALPTHNHNSFQYQCVLPSSSMTPIWPDEETDDFKAPNSKRRQTTSSQTANLEMTSFPASIHNLTGAHTLTGVHTGGNFNSNYSYFYENGPDYNRMSSMPREQGIARAH